MKKIISVILVVITVMALMIPVQAAYYGDVNGDNKITAADARAILRHSAKLAILPTNVQNRADVDGNGSVNAADARTTLRMSAKLAPLKEIQDDPAAKIAVTDYNGVKANKLPYTLSGLKIESIKFNSVKKVMTVAVRNTAGYAVDNSSSLKYKTYDEAGVLIAERTLFLRNMNNNEACLVEFDVHKDTAKLVFFEAKPEKCSFVPSYNMTTINGIQVNAMPLQMNGIVINSISFDDKYDNAVMSISNKMGYAISSLSYISYKTYNSDGYIVGSRDIFLEEMNNNENALVDFYYAEGTKKMVFYAVDIEKSTTLYQGEMVDIGNMSVNKMPYTSNGITLEKAEYQSKSMNLNVTFKNSNNFAISEYSGFDYKIYNAENFVVKSNTVYTTHLNSGEKCLKSIYIPEGAVKVVFGVATPKQDSALTVSSYAKYGTIEANKLPYTASGLRVDSVSASGTTVTVKLTNVSGSAITDSSYIHYKCYDASGVVLKDTVLSTYTLNNNESMLREIYVPDGTVKVAFLNATVKTRDAKKTFATSMVDSAVQFNNRPVNISGLSIDSARYDASTRYLYASVTNNTGKNLKDSTYLHYVCYDSAGNVVRDNVSYTERLNAGYKCEVKFSVPQNVVKIVVFEAKIAEA